MKRQFKGIVRSLFTAKTYKAAKDMFLIFDRPFEVLRRYIFVKGDYPCTLSIRTAVGTRTPTFYSFHDIRSLVVSFAKHDYYAGPDVKCVVDFGSNIGVSGLYFLTRNEKVRVYLFEPLERNVARLTKNLKGLEDRYTLEQCAIGLKDETTKFHFEPSGRYGGISDAVADDHSVERPYEVEVRVLEAAAVLRRILEKEGYIDLLKLNIEGMETDVLNSLGPDILERVGVICAEIFDYEGEISGFRKEKYGRNITRFINQMRMLGANESVKPV